MEYINKLREHKYFTEIAFVVAILLLLGAWKFGIESLLE